MFLRKIFLRIRQLVRAIQAQPLTEPQLAYLRTILSPAQATLFAALPVYEQVHALNVCRTLVRTGYGHDSELLQAALLHDLGKHDPATGKSIPVWVKIAGVILGRQRVKKLGCPGDPADWRYLFWLQAHHEKRSVELLQAVGCEGRVIELVEGYQLKSVGLNNPAARALSWADDQN